MLIEHKGQTMETKLYDEVKRGIHKFDKGDKAIKEYLELK